MMHLQSLEGLPFEQVFRCFEESFRGYFVPLNFDPALWKARWAAARIDWSASQGAFDGDRLVGILLLALEPWEGEMTAFNGGTGVIPEYRGRRLVRALYEAAFPLLRDRSVERLCLEVITQNTAAVQAYRSVGMEIGRSLQTYIADVAFAPRVEEETLLQQKHFDAVRYAQCVLWTPAFESSADTIRAYGRACSTYEYRKEETLLGYAVLQRDRKMALQLGIDTGRISLEEGLAGLLAALRRLEPELRLINVDSGAEGVCRIIEAQGFLPVVSQYEMRGPLPAAG